MDLMKLLEMAPPMDYGIRPNLYANYVENKQTGPVMLEIAYAVETIGCAVHADIVYFEAWMKSIRRF
jgi:hypothetical protein